MEQLTGKRPKLYVDVRQLLEDPDVDVVSTATPNHWHALITIWACRSRQGCVRGKARLLEAL